MKIIWLIILSCFSSLGLSGQDYRLNIRDFGALGDSTDQTAAFQNVISAAINGNGSGVKSSTQRRDIVIPEGDYIITSPIVIEPQDGGTSIRNIRFIGEGGNNVQEGTRLLFDIATADTSCLVIKSGFFIDFENITFRNRQDNRSIVEITAEDSPVFSGTSMEFRRCHFAPWGSATCTKAMVDVNNMKLVTFDGCWFSVGSTSNVAAILAGGDQADHLGSLQQGVLHNLIVRDCFLFSAIDLRNCKQYSIEDCVFGEEEHAVIRTSGDERVQAGRIVNCTFVGDTDETSITLGSYDPGTSNSERAGQVIIQGCQFRDQKVAINVGSIGYVDIIGCEFLVRRAGDIGIVIPSTAKNVNISTNNNFDLPFRNDCVSVDDQRLTSGDLMANADLFVNQYLSASYVTTTTAFEEVLSQDNLEFVEGMHYVSYKVSVRNGSGTDMRVRVQVRQVLNDGTIHLIPLGTAQQVDTGTDATISASGWVYLHGDIKENDPQCSIDLRVQGEGGTGVTVRGSADSNTLGRTYLQVKKGI